MPQRASCPADVHVLHAQRILILADDLSGAADCGVACTEAGLETMVLLDARTAESGATALALDLDSRKLPASSAAAAITRAAARLLGPGSVLYKKIDSTLRGHPAVEIAAAVGAVADRVKDHERPLAIVAPAFPATGRVVRGGRLFVNDVRLEDTEIWRREGNGLDPDLAAMLRAAGLQTRIVPIAAVRSHVLPIVLRQAAADMMGAVLCDAENDTDLALIATAGLTLGPGVAWAGSAGLARPLAALIAKDMGNVPCGARATRGRGPLVAVIGSMSAVARAQLAALSSLPGTVAWTGIAGSLTHGEASPHWAAAEQQLREAFAAADDDSLVIVSIGVAAPAHAIPTRSLCTTLARLMAPHVLRVGGLIATGGETARSILGAAGAAGLRLVGEIEAGVPMGIATRPDAAPLPVITKAGAFGDPDTLVRCVAALHALPKEDR